MKELLIFIALLAPFRYSTSSAQQGPDLAFEPHIAVPAYSSEQGPIVSVDEAHHNFHTISTRYNAFAKVLSRDGYNVKPNTKPFTLASLEAARVLVNAKQNLAFLLNIIHWLDQRN